ncbi:MAG: glycosyltransferase family 4 protein [Gaiellaceae bacterium]
MDRSFEAADAIVLLNSDELRFVSERLGHERKAVLLPNGLGEERLRTLAGAAASPQARLSERRVVFVGHLNERKGLGDIASVVREVRRRVPEARFSLLGVAIPAGDLLGRFAPEDRGGVEIVERFAPERLPALLANATAGVLPSYLEGFPIGVLEQLAARIPTVAYDAPGSRELLGPLPGALSPVGDPGALGAQVARVLSLPEREYAEAAERAQARAGQFRWRDIARDTLAVYEAARRAR